MSRTLDQNRRRLLRRLVTGAAALLAALGTATAVSAQPAGQRPRNPSGQRPPGGGMGPNGGTRPNGPPTGGGQHPPGTGGGRPGSGQGPRGGGRGPRG